TACASTRVTWPPSIPATVSRFPGRAFGRACSQSSEDLMRIVFHGFNALPFHQDFDRALKVPAEVHYMPDQLAPEDEAVYAGADGAQPRAGRLMAVQEAGAGYDRGDHDQLPPEAAVDNADGDEGAIAEYVLAAMLADTVPVADADQRLRQGEWAYMAGRREAT